MIYKYKWLNRFMLKFFKKAYAKRYLKKYPEAYKSFGDGVYCVNLTMMFGNTKTSDKKLKKIMDKVTEDKLRGLVECSK